MKESALVRGRVARVVVRTGIPGLLCGTLLWLLGSPGTIWAREGDTQTTLFIGTSFVNIGPDTTDGTTLGARWGYEFQDDLLWTIGGAYTTTQGQKTVNGTDYTLTADTTTLQTGLLYYFGRKPGKLLVPFVGAGLAAIDYDVDYRYPGSPTGKTSGDGPGGFAFAGVEVWLLRSLTLIVSYEEEAYQIQQQHGGNTSLVSGGLILSLRLNVYSE
jgi:hypothetical protein